MLAAFVWNAGSLDIEGGYVEFFLLGPVEARSAGLRVSLGEAEQPKIRCVLTVLLYPPGQLVTAEVLDRRIWGEKLPQPRTRYKYIGTLRKELEKHGVDLAKEGNGYRIDLAREQVDLYRFRHLAELGRRAMDGRQFAVAAEQLTRALGLWRGPALTGIPGAWADGEGAKLDREREAAERLRFRAELEIGPTGEQIGRFAVWHAESGPDSESAALLMTAYCRIGRPDLAEACYRSTANRMKALGLLPDASLRWLMDRVRQRDPGLFARTVVTGPPAVGPPSAPGPVQIGAIPELADGFQVRGIVREIEAEMEDAAGVSRWTLSGLGGVGKTQLAACLARRLLDSGRADPVVWITASSRQSVVDLYARALTEVLGIGGGTAEHDATRFLDWLASTDQSWLIVLDDLISPDIMSGLWPRASSAGRVLVTTQRRDASLPRERWHNFGVTRFSAAEARSYLAVKLAGHGDLARGAEDLADALDNLPIALSQAVAYLLDREITCAEYKHRLAELPLAQVLPEPSALPDSQQRTAEETWLISAEHANTLAPQGLARPLLELASHLDPAEIPEQIFLEPAAVGYLSSVLGREVSAVDSRDALRCLQRLSLVTLYPADPGYRVRIHSLVQKAARDHLPDHRRAQAKLACADAIVSAWPPADADAGLTQAFRANALALAEPDGGDLMARDVHRMLFLLSRSLGDSGSFAAAAEHLHRVRAAASRHFGPEHPDVIKARLYEAYWLGEGGDTARAIPLLQDLVPDSARVLGPEHRLTLDAGLYSARYRGKAGDLRQAREDLAQLVGDLTRVLGRDDKRTMTARHDLAWSMAEQDDYSGALREFAEVRDDRERVLGPDHHHTLITRNNLAYYTARSGDNVAALRAFQELLPDMRRKLGPVHQHTLATRGNIARLREKTDDREGAVRELRPLLDEMRRELGADHPITVATATMLAAMEP